MKRIILTTALVAVLSAPVLAAGTLEAPAFSFEAHNLQYAYDVSPQPGGQFLIVDTVPEGIQPGDVIELIDDEDKAIVRLGEYDKQLESGKHSLRIYDKK